MTCNELQKDSHTARTDLHQGPGGGGTGRAPPAACAGLTITAAALFYRAEMAQIHELKALRGGYETANLPDGNLVCMAVALVLSAQGIPALAAAPATVRLIVDYGDGVQTHYKALPWKDGMTVVDALSAAQKHARPLKVTQRGRGSGALIIAIDDLESEGRGKNWLFSVNDKQAEVGAGSYELQAGDTVLWEYKEYDYNQ